MERLVLSGLALLPGQGFTVATLTIEDGKIVSVRPGLESAADLTPEPGGCIVPGFIDLQVNGAYGADLTSDPCLLGKVTQGLLATGTTAFLPTVITSEFDTYPRRLADLRGAAGEAQGAQVLGVHLEGPYLSPRRKGAHDPTCLRPIDVDEIIRWADPEFTRIVTLAPELPGAPAAITALRRRGLVVSAGHSDATFAQAQAGFAAGITWGTHLFNAMSPLAHREPGLAGALLTAPFPCGVIADGEHLHPAVVALAYRLKGPAGLSLVTDAMAAMGMPAGRYMLANQEVLVDATTARLADGTLAGSVLRMDAAVHNMVRFSSCTLADAVTMATTTPASVLGLAGKGRLAIGCDADLVLLDATLRVTHTLVRGAVAYQA